jgi:Mg2+/citrate symporter
VTISVLKVDFESNTIAPALKVLFQSIIIDSVAMCMFDILNFGIINEKGLLLKQK